MCQNHYIVAAEEEQPVCLPVSLICTRRGQLVDFGSFLLFFLKAHCNPFRKQSLTLLFFLLLFPNKCFPILIPEFNDSVILAIISRSLWHCQLLAKVRYFKTVMNHVGSISLRRIIEIHSNGDMIRASFSICRKKRRWCNMLI